jgi:hypothetical protein
MRGLNFRSNEIIAVPRILFFAFSMLFWARRFRINTLSQLHLCKV